MTASTASRNTPLEDQANSSVSVLLLDTPENLGIDFLQALQRQDLKLVYERVNDKEALHAALRQGTWDILLVCDQVHVPGQDETLAFLEQLDCETGYILLSKSELTIDALTRAYRRGIAAVVSAQNAEYSFHVFAREAERCRRNMQLNRLNQDKFDLKRHCMQLMSGTQEALAYLQDGIHVYGNDAYLKLLGYKNLDALLVLPFIDLVSTEMREKAKQRLVDFQHKVRLKPETQELEIPELFVHAIGEREGILQVAATFKPVIHEGESCVQVVFKQAGAEEKREGSAAAEGLGYPLFITHLDSLVAQARATNKPQGHVLHVRGLGCEQYMTRKGFGSLNGKLKALASELKESLGKHDLLIRFTETSLLVLRKTGTAAPDEAIAHLLARFEAAMNRELGVKGEERIVRFSFARIAVDAKAASAEQMVKSFLQTRQMPPPAAGSVASSKLDAPIQPVPAPLKATAPIPATPPATPAPDSSRVDLQRVSAAFAGNQMKLRYETVISVANIETEFHDVCLYLPHAFGGGEHLARLALGDGDAEEALATKIDRWIVQSSLAVVADLYKRGQEYPVLLPLSAGTLADRRLAEFVGKTLQDFGLPAPMLILDFAVGSLGDDNAVAVSRLESLKALGIGLCISEVQDPGKLVLLAERIRFQRVRLQRALVAEASQNPAAFTRLESVVDKLHGARFQVLAGDVANPNELALCCKARIDLVKGKCIQNSPHDLDVGTMAAELMN